MAEAWRRRLAGSDPLHAVSLLELSSFVGERLLRDTDTASMAVALEVRVPLLDHVLIETVAGIEPARRFEPVRQKQLLRDVALGGLDPAIFDRPKSGFVLPIDVWARQTLQPRMAALFQDGRWHAASASAGKPCGPSGGRSLAPAGAPLVARVGALRPLVVVRAARRVARGLTRRRALLGRAGGRVVGAAQALRVVERRAPAQQALRPAVRVAQRLQPDSKRQGTSTWGSFSLRLKMVAKASRTAAKTAW